MKALACPKLYKHCLKYAMTLCRRRPNQIEEAKDLVHDAYVKVLSQIKQWNAELIPFEDWVIRKVRDCWRKGLDKKRTCGRELAHHMCDVPWVIDDEGYETGPDAPIAPRQEDIVYAKECLKNCPPADRHRIIKELGNNGENAFGDVHLGADRRDDERRELSEADRLRKSDLWAKQQIARCDIRRKRQDRTRAGLAFA